MATWLEQTKRAYRIMKAAGFKRSEFKAHTPYENDVEGYAAKAVITAWPSHAEMVERIPALLEAGMDVTQYRWQDAEGVTRLSRPHLSEADGSKGTHTICDMGGISNG